MDPDPGLARKAVHISRQGACRMRRDGLPRRGGGRKDCPRGGKRSAGSSRRPACACALAAASRPARPAIAGRRPVPSPRLAAGVREPGRGAGLPGPLSGPRAVSPPGRACAAAGPGGGPAGGVLGLAAVVRHADRIPRRRMPVGGPSTGPPVDSRLAPGLPLVPLFGPVGAAGPGRAMPIAPPSPPPPPHPKTPQAPRRQRRARPVPRL